MNHPKPEEWAEYVAGELDPRERRALSEHLQSCPECTARVAGWQRTIGKLSTWRLPQGKALAIRGRGEPLVKWAIAAVLMLGIGFGFGRMGMFPRENGQLRAELMREVERAVIRAQIDCSKAIAAAEERAQEASDGERRQLWRATMEALRAGRDEDRRATIALLERLEEQQDLKLVALRRDLETLASMADEGLQEARLKILEFASTRNE